MTTRCNMIKSITIANRDERCNDCKLTTKSVVVVNPSLWQRLWHKMKPYPKIEVEVWYGRMSYWQLMGNRWTAMEAGPGVAWTFNIVWAKHCKKKKKANIKGPYTTTFTMKDEQWKIEDSTKL